MHDWSGLHAFRVIDEYSHGNINNDNLRCFLRQFDCYAAISEETGAEVWGTTQQQHCDDLSRLVRRYDKDVNGSWSFREFLTYCQPLTQYSLKAKDLSTALVLGDSASKADKKASDKQLLAETSSTSSLGELNHLLKRKASGKENRTSRASKSTAAHSQAPLGGGYSTIGGAGMQASINNDHDDLYNMSAFENNNKNVMDYPYMFDSNANNEEL